VALRTVVAGSIDGDPLPAFHQQALGAEGSLPGYGLYQFDCRGHRSDRFVNGQQAYYGCDRLALFQIEYQARFRWLSVIGRSIGRDFGLLENVRGVLFFDTGRAWTLPRSVGIRSTGPGDFAADAGFGLRFGVLGVYWARQLSARADGLNFFVRLEPRI
jgi:hypothetical protein